MAVQRVNRPLKRKKRLMESHKFIEPLLYKLCMSGVTANFALD